MLLQFDSRVMLFRLLPIWEWQALYIPLLADRVRSASARRINQINWIVAYLLQPMMFSESNSIQVVFMPLLRRREILFKKAAVYMYSTIQFKFNKKNNIIKIRFAAGDARSDKNG